MTLHCASNRTLHRLSASVHCLDNGKTPRTGKPSRQQQSEEALLRRIKCHLMTELDYQDQTHLKIYVSLAMPTSLQALTNDITFHVDDQRHTLRVTDLGGHNLPEENNWQAMVYRGTAASGIVAASASLGCS